MPIPYTMKTLCPFEELYRENMYTSKDYHRLYDTALSSYLKSHLRENKYRDKRIQRFILGLQNPDVINVFYCAIDQVPLYMHARGGSIPGSIIDDIARWRLMINK